MSVLFRLTTVHQVPVIGETRLRVKAVTILATGLIGFIETPNLVQGLVPS
jgi:hypothetical protein